MPDRYDNEDLLRRLLGHPHFASFKKVGADDWRDTSEKNPPLSLSTKGLFDHKSNTSTSLFNACRQRGLLDEPAPRSRQRSSKPKPTDTKTKNSETASKIWKDAAANSAQAPAEKYFTKHRKIPLSNYRDLLNSGIIRFVPRSEYPARAPMLVTRVHQPKSTKMAIHRIELGDDGAKLSKKMLGGTGVTMIPPLSGEAPDHVCVCEGLEDALSLRAAFRTSMFLVANTKGNLALVPQFLESHELPVTILSDHDANENPSENGQTDAAKLRKALIADGFNVTAQMPAIANDDANRALQDGRLNEWLESLEDVPEIEETGEDHHEPITVYWLRYDEKSDKYSILPAELVRAFLSDEPTVDLDDESTAKKALAAYVRTKTQLYPITSRELSDLVSLAKILRADEPWAPPQPLDALSDGRRPYPLDKLPSVVRSAIEDLEKFSQAPTELCAQVILSNAAFASQAVCNVKRPAPEEDIVCGINLNAVTIGESSERKSTADGAVSGYVSPEEERLRTEWETVYKRLKAAHDIWQIEVNGLKSQINKLRSNPNGFDEHELGNLEEKLRDAYQREPQSVPEDKEHFLPRLVVKNFSSQALARRLSACPSIFLNSSEGGQTLGAYSFQKDNLVNTLGDLNELFSSGTVRNDRMGDNSVHVEGGRLSINLMLQPVIAEPMFSDPKYLHSGFLARALIAYPQTRAGQRQMNPAAALQKDKTGLQSLNAFKNRCRNLLQCTRINAETKEITFSTLEMGEQAGRAWIEYYNELDRRTAPNGDLASARIVAGKSPEMAARIAACLHLVEHVVPPPQGLPDDAEPPHDFPLTIELPMIEAGITLARWYLDEFQRVLSGVGENQAVHDAKVLLKWLHEHPKAEDFRSGRSMDLRTLRQSGPRTSGCREKDPQRRDAALSVLINSGHIRMSEDAKRFKGNPLEFFKN